MRQHFIDQLFLDGFIPKSCREDAKTIRTALNTRWGLTLSNFQAYTIWEEYSDQQDAQWLSLPSRQEQLEKYDHAMQLFVQSRMRILNEQGKEWTIPTSSLIQ